MLPMDLMRYAHSWVSVLNRQRRGPDSICPDFVPDRIRSAVAPAMPANRAAPPFAGRRWSRSSPALSPLKPATMVWSICLSTAGSIQLLNAYSPLVMPTQRTWVCGPGHAPVACRFSKRPTPSSRMRLRIQEAWNIFQALAEEFEETPGRDTPRAELTGLYTRNMYIGPADQ